MGQGIAPESTEVQIAGGITLTIICAQRYQVNTQSKKERNQFFKFLVDAELLTPREARLLSRTL